MTAQDMRVLSSNKFRFSVLAITAILVAYFLPDLFIRSEIANIELLKTSKFAHKAISEEINMIETRFKASLALMGFIIFMIFKSDKIHFPIGKRIDYLVIISIFLCLLSISLDFNHWHALLGLIIDNVDFTTIGVFSILSYGSELSMMLSIIFLFLFFLYAMEDS